MRVGAGKPENSPFLMIPLRGLGPAPGTRLATVSPRYGLITLNHGWPRVHWLLGSRARTAFNPMEDSEEVIDRLRSITG